MRFCRKTVYDGSKIFCNPSNNLITDIHELVDEVASIFELDSVVIRLKLIVNLLLAAGKSNSDTEDDDSVSTCF